MELGYYLLIQPPDGLVIILSTFDKEFTEEVATNFAGEIYGGRYSKGRRYSEGI